jgi:hypothetical protein
VRKVYSVNIVYFDLGAGDDYVYHGVTNFKGLHTQSELHLSPDQQRLYSKKTIGELYPGYYITKANGFDDEAKDTLDEWIYYLKNNRIKDEFTAKGLDKARAILAIDVLSEEEKAQYERDMDNKVMSDAAIRTAIRKGRNEGEAERNQLIAEKTQLISEKTQLKGEQTQLKGELQAAQERIAELERIIISNQS